MELNVALNKCAAPWHKGWSGTKGIVGTSFVHKFSTDIQKTKGTELVLMLCVYLTNSQNWIYTLIK